MKKVLFVFSVLISFGAQAAELNTRPWLALMAGGSTATSTMDVSSDADRAFSVGMGWDISEHLAAEFNYSDLGKVTFKDPTNDVEMSARSFSAALLPTLRFGNSRLFGRLGLSRWDAETSTSDKTTGDTISSKSRTGVEPLVGAGYEFRLGREAIDWSLRVDWQHHFTVGQKKYTGEADIDTLMLGLTFRH